MINLINTDWETIQVGLKKYLQIMKLLKATNVQQNDEFRRLFNGFYRIRQRSELFYDTLYEYLETNKFNQVSFPDTLAHFKAKLNRFEPSFSSKIVATIDPNLPVWDSEVLKRLNLKSPGNYLEDSERFYRIVKTYIQILSWYNEFLSTDEAKKLLKEFDKNIGIFKITDIKKLDFILWQTRD